MKAHKTEEKTEEESKERSEDEGLQPGSPRKKEEESLKTALSGGYTQC